MVIAGAYVSQWFTRFGESEILLPVVLGLVAWTIVKTRSVKSASPWLLPLGIAAFITTLSKIAFIGWGIGIASINFTGFSGHSMFSAAIYPVVALALTSHLRDRGDGRWPTIAVIAGYLFAAAIAYSRIRVGAHSWSEVITGYALGAAASACTLWLMGHSQHRPPLRWAVLGIAGWLAVMPLQAAPSRTHDMVTRLALTLADRQHPYRRADLFRQPKVVEAEEVRFY